MSALLIIISLLFIASACCSLHIGRKCRAKVPWFLFFGSFLMLALTTSAPCFLEATIINHSIPIINLISAILFLIGIYLLIKNRFASVYHENCLVAHELNVSRKRFKNLIETTADWIWEMDVNANFTYVSPRVKDILGYEPEELIGKSGYSIMPPDEADRIQAEFDKFVSQNKPFKGLINKNIRNDGTVVILESNGVPFFDASGNLLGYRGADRDVTEREIATIKLQKSREQLKESETRFTSFMDKTPAIVFMLDHEARTLYINKQMRDLFKADDSWIGKRADELFPGDIGKKMQEDSLSVLDEKVKIIEENVYTVAGEKRTYRTTKFIIERQNDDPWIGGISWDITQEKELEERLRQADKMQAIGQLAGGVAHDFNNQLAAIIGFVDMIQSQLKDPTLTTYTQKILTAAIRASDLTKQLLAFARKGLYRQEPTDVHHLITDVVSILQHSIDKRINIITQLNSTQYIVDGDPSQLQNAFLNLALNSRDAMADGGELIFKTENIELAENDSEGSFSCLPAGEYLKIDISDTGHGISEDVIPHIFEPFFTTKEEGKGTGMGLAAVYGTINNHSGMITVTSNVDKGTTMTIILPLSTAPSTIIAEHAKESPVIDGNASILIIDDEELVKEACSDMLDLLGFQTSSCSNGKEAIEFYKTHHQDIHLVILDMIMPELGGAKTFAELKKINPDIKVLLASGYSLNGEAQKVLDQGACDFIQKPFRPTELSSLVLKILEKQ